MRLSLRTGILLAALLALAAASAAPAAVIHVTTHRDELNSDGDCSLREAVRSANLDNSVDACTKGNDKDWILLGAGRYEFRAALSGEDDAAVKGDLDLTGTVGVRGAGRTRTIVDANDVDRIFHVQNGANAVIAGLTIENGHVVSLSEAAGGAILVSGVLRLKWAAIRYSEAFGQNGGLGSGGGLAVEFGKVATVEHSRIIDNKTAQSGGGVYSEGNLALDWSKVLGNSAQFEGGGVYVATGGDSAINDSWIAANRVTNTGANGGGLAIAKGHLDRTTISGNTARNGDGVLVFGEVQMWNVTVSRNGSVASGGNGGGIYHGTGLAGDSLTLENVTIAGNAASSTAGSGGNLWLGGPVSAKNVLVSDNRGGANCGGNLDNFNYAGPNLSDDATCGAFATGDAKLRRLANYGGWTKTQALGSGSAALNAGSACTDSDERGVSRPQGPACDLGAYELARCFNRAVNRVGTDRSERFRGTAANEVFLTQGGNDTVNPGAGTDRVCAGSGNDKVVIASGEKDFADGGSGTDRVRRDFRDSVRAFERFF